MRSTPSAEIRFQMLWFENLNMPRRQKKGIEHEDVTNYTRSELSALVSSDDMQRLEKEALQTINQQLVRTEDLHVTIPRLYALCRGESSEVRKSMNSMIATQTGEAHRCLRILRDAREKVDSLREKFIEQGNILAGMQTAACYRQMKQLNTFRANVQRVIEWTEALKAIHHVDFDARLQDGYFTDVYDQLRKTQQIRLAIQSGGARAQQQAFAFEPYFMKLDVIIAVFLDHVKGVFEDSTMIAIVHALNDGDDGAAPEDAAAQQASKRFESLSQCIMVCSREIVEPLLHYDSSGTGELRLTEQEVEKWICDSVSKTWVDEIMADVTDPMTQVYEYLDAMKKIEQILMALELSLLPLSSRFPFFALMVNAFHQEVMRVMKRYADPENELEAEKLLEAIKFLRWYHSAFEEDNYAQYVQLSQVDVIIADMMKSAVSGMSNHLIHLSQSCALTTCSMAPSQMPNGQMFTPGPADLFAILQQSLGSITCSFEQEVAQKLGQACVDGIRSYIGECKKQCDFDLWEDEKGQGPYEEWAAKRLNFLFAFANDLSTIEQNLETIELKFANSWSDDVDQTPFQVLQDEIPETVTFYVDEIIAHVEKVVSDAWNKMFSKEWLESNTNPLSVILETEADFIQEDFATALQNAHAEKLTKSMMISCFRKYLNRLAAFLQSSVDAKWKTDEEAKTFSWCLQRDSQQLQEFWTELVVRSRVQLVEQGSSAIHVLSELVLAVANEGALDKLIRDSILDSFGDCPSFVVQYIIEKRGDLPKSARDAALARWKDRIAYQRRVEDVFKDWKFGQTFLGGIDRSLGPEEKAGFFGRRTKPQKEDEQSRRRREKEEKRHARQQESQSKASSGKKKKKSAAANAEVEVMTLQDLLN